MMPMMIMGDPDTAKAAAEEGMIQREDPSPSGAKARLIPSHLMYGLKPVPFTGSSFSVPQGLKPNGFEAT